MSEDKLVSARIADEHHIWIKGRQFVSLERFIELTSKTNDEMKKLADEVKKLTIENDALRVLLKDVLK